MTFSEKVVILYHGTSTESAKIIIKDGFVVSSGGQLGTGKGHF
jgi:RNA:NAD 2'-phosphotransferase (TPT1/KptA family)